MERPPPCRSGQKRPLPSTTTPCQVNDHIYELYKPPEDSEPSMDILFFHGLQFGESTDAYKSTWTCGSEDATEQIWPSTWLIEEFPNANIFSMSYDSCVRQTREHGRFGLHNVAENMIQAIVWAGIGQGLRRPVVLVGHCFGGLVMKALCVEAHRTHSLGSPDREMTHKIELFLDNVGGLFFYGTPHHGSPSFDKASHLFGGLLLDYVKILNEKSAKLQADFAAVCKKHNIQHFASVGEKLPTVWKYVFREVVVPEASARYGDFCTVATDHIKICKPASKTSNSFQHLITFLRNIQPKVASGFGNRQLTPNALVGLDSAVKELEHLLRLNERVGIVGMGGIGKTTLAKAVFNELGPTFDYSCFIYMVKKIEGSVETVEKVIWDRLDLHGEKKTPYQEGCWSMLSPKRLLLVLDDIDSDRDLEVLSNIADAMRTGDSRFIMTSRDGVLLNNIDYTYRIPFLAYINAKQLFISYAFPKQAVLPSALESSVEDMVKKCDGLPLTLELMGKYLRNKKNVQVWEETLHDLDKANVFSQADEKLWARLRSCYNGLGEKEQQVFLDATTFFIDTDWTLHEALTAWGSIYVSPHRLWHTLLDMSFVYDVQEDQFIRVHEQLQSLGRKIASESTKCRIWEYREALKLLQSTNDSNGQQIHSLRLGSTTLGTDQPLDLKVDVSSSGFQRLHTVRYLDFNYSGLNDPVSIQYEGPQEKQAFPTDQVVLLQCSYEQFDSLSFSPTLFTRLVILKLSCSSPVTEHLPRLIGQFLSLRILEISARPFPLNLPDEIGGLLKLEHLTLYCDMLKLPTSFGDLSNLKHLDISCMSLEPLPESFGQLKELKHLKFQSLILHSLPESFGYLSTLEYLKIRIVGSEWSLPGLPESFGLLSTLEHLELASSNLTSLPESFGHLPELKHLEIAYCNKVDSLPESFGHLPMLKHLTFTSCNKLDRLSESFGHLPMLKHLTFTSCNKLDSLPESFGRLSQLEHLVFDCCPNLASLPESFGRLPSLEHLLFYNCSDLASLPLSFGQLAKLQDLVIRKCPLMDRLPDSLAELKDLRRLVIGYIALTSIPDSIKALPSLQTLELGTLPDVEEFPPWLGEITPFDLTPVSKGVGRFFFKRIGERIFHVRDECFALAEEKIDEYWNSDLFDWYEGQTRRKLETSDYGGALAAVSNFHEFELALYYGDDDDYQLRWTEILVTKGILKRLCGDSHGALEDLNTAMDMIKRLTRSAEFCEYALRRERGYVRHIFFDDHEGAQEFFEYALRRERGYVRYILLGDEEAAREDGEEAFKYQCRFTDRHICEYGATVDQRFFRSFFTFRAVSLDELKEFVLDRPVLSYLNFEFLGREEYMENVNHLHSLHCQAMEKVRRSDFAGALADFDAVDDINVRLIGFRAQAYMLQERGILKRLTGDLDGALGDLTSTLKVFADHQFEEGHYSFASGYESWKHRGYVKYLQKDVDGAQDDAATAEKLKKDFTDRHHHQPDPTSFRSICRSIGREWNGDERLCPHDHDDDGEEGCASEDKSEVFEGKFTSTYFRLGSQALKFLGFNLS